MSQVEKRIQPDQMLIIASLAAGMLVLCNFNIQIRISADNEFLEVGRNRP